ncbi:4-hydroxybenzoate polyprenyltransferase [Clostridium cavendishii DSM 21758]|uniref:4-hydroxybenzoate polyprenyltransferase n=1 Tax=Clostridium cavendishii DSM 21758 TaxID=1121302 RepID=A0A1M6UNC1_9CLOT|nr:decaprenyl-phosphate phosphoribosyltransferase [Clostridium cavendishii]SHK70640.1 4-hydroxybenzoate polyprenyltransferase [Clostridium cavendishii DSM 21758]
MKDKFLSVIKLLRIEQWIKNMFVFGPILFSNNIFNSGMIEKSFTAFIAFCFISSCVYIMNDIVDREKDRKHPKKCNRPIASGKVQVFEAIILAVILAGESFIIAFSINKYLVLIILLYLVNNVLYSFKIKNVVLLDVFSIGIGFILRVLAGSFAIGVKTSSWILLCTLFLSLFLGFGKRRNEVIVLGEDAKEHRKNLSQYNEKLLDQIINIVLACTIVFYAIYCVVGTGDQNFIWTTILVLFGILRYYYLMYSKGQGGNPTELVIRDKQLSFCVIFWIICSAGIMNF